MFFIKQKTAYELRISAGVQTCALPIWWPCWCACPAGRSHGRYGSISGSSAKGEVAMQPKQIVTPKSFYVAERDRFYSDWTMSFWRELFQNSVDAGAKAIRVSISNEDGKGSCGDRKSVVEGKSVSVRVDLGGRRSIKKKKNK